MLNKQILRCRFYEYTKHTTYGDNKNHHRKTPETLRLRGILRLDTMVSYDTNLYIL